ncbi:MAG: L-histidine N(alpha)-methyltransferase [Acidobacteria bacterium]|nr:MAG: L-histidine N(alpha)-methyltransferase [Acidobacteriota bacterium]
MLDTAPDPTAERLRLHQLLTGDARALFAADVRRGLSTQPKQLFPKYFYDELGSLLFDAICLLPEYYLTRAEHEILTRHAGEIIAAVGSAQLALLELGSGSATKTRHLIEAICKRQPQLLYRPIDISAAALETSARVLLQSYPSLRIEAYASDYDTALARLRAEAEHERVTEAESNLSNAATRNHTLALFLGSNIGNFDRAEAETFLRRLRAVLRTNDALLLGADLKKDPARLVAAYDDALGVTAAFNLNLLTRLNREFAADFKPRAFRHVALYNEVHGRIELYLESRRAQVVHLPALDLEIAFAAGERMHTENSYKYDLIELDELAARTDFARTQTWTDTARRFSSNLLIAV